MSRFFLIVLPMLFIAGCSDNPVDTNSSQIKYEQLFKLLDEAYDQNSQDQLDTFFEKWNELSGPITADEFTQLTDIEQEAYQIFLEFYSPTDLNKLTHGQHENFETEFRFIVVQNQLEIAVVDTNPKFYFYRGVSIDEHFVEDFRPNLSEDEFPIVHLTPEADSLIYHFIFDADSSNRNDSEARVQFLRQAMQLTPHHWIADFHKYTMPHADRVIFNEEFDEALIQFRVFFQFGDAYFEKNGNNWILKESELTAIE